VAVLVAFQTIPPYRDDARESLTTRVSTHGPYRGLFTTLEKAEYVQAVSDAVDRAAADPVPVRPVTGATGARTIFFYDLFPAGYVMTSLRPQTNTLWTLPLSMSPGSDRQSTVDYMASHGDPDVVVHMKNLMITRDHFFHAQDVPGDPLDAYVKSPRFERAGSTDICDVYRRRSSHP
jgi:hypothetical protein